MYFKNKAPAERFLLFTYAVFFCSAYKKRDFGLIWKPFFLMKIKDYWKPFFFFKKVDIKYAIYTPIEYFWAVCHSSRSIKRQNFVEHKLNRNVIRYCRSFGFRFTTTSRKQENNRQCAIWRIHHHGHLVKRTRKIPSSNWKLIEILSC